MCSSDLRCGGCHAGWGWRVILILKVLEIVAPVLILGAVGYVWARRGHDYPVAFVTRLAMTVAMPPLIFTALVSSDIAPQALGQMIGAAALGYGALTLAFWVLVRLSGLDRRTWLGPMIFGNTGNVGLPLALFAFGDSGLTLAVVVFAVMLVWNFTFGLWLVSGGGAPGRLLRDPIMIASLLGVLFLWQGWQSPVWLTNSLTLIGQISIPLMLITLGVAVARLKGAGLARAGAISALRLAICLAVGIAVGRALGLPPQAFAVLVLQLATPVAVTSYLLAQRHGADADAVAGLVIASTLLSLITLPLTIGVLL